MLDIKRGIKMALLIAEIGQNFVGDLNLAKRMIWLAKEFGAGLVKFQLYGTGKLYTPNTELYRLAKESELSFLKAKDLFEYGQKMRIEVFFSVFDIERVKWCEVIGVKRYKVAYSQRHNAELLNSIKGGIIISSDHPVSLANKTLYCIPHYPTQLNELEFDRLSSFDGFSDHTIGLDASKIALARGARIIEKHFCVDHKTGVDAPWSMTPVELWELKQWEQTVSQVL